MIEKQNIHSDANDGLDNLFRNALGSHQMEPSGGLWKGISRKLLWTELAHFNFSNLPRAFWIGTASAFLIGMIFLVSQIPDGKVTENSYSPAIPGQNYISSSSAFISNSNHSASPVKHHPENTSSTSSTSTNTATYASLIPSNLPLSVNTGTSRTANDPVILASTGSGRNLYDLVYMYHISSGNLFPNTAEDTMLRFITQNSILNVPKTKRETPQFLTLNLGISPEVSVYRGEDLYSTTNYWLNASMTYHAGRFSISTGFDLGYIFDRGNYRVNYKSKDSIGFFTSIVSFIVNPDNTVVYTTKDIPVYDSLQHIADDKGNNRYTYLQIPLLLGFEVIETNHLSLGIKAGPALSFLIGTKKAVPFVDHPNARLILVEDNTMQRVKTNWEFQVGLDLEYRLSKNFSVYAQPYYKHYFKPFIQQEGASAKDPYSIGLGIGTRFNFGLKKTKP